MKMSHPSERMGAAVELARARARLTTAEDSVQTAKDESRKAKRKRKEAKDAVRCAKKRLRRAKEELAEARSALTRIEDKLARRARRATSQGNRFVPITAFKPPASKRVTKRSYSVNHVRAAATSFGGKNFTGARRTPAPAKASA